MRGKPVTPPGGLDIGLYDKHLKEHAPQKKREYKETLDQQQKEHMLIRARQEPEMPVLDRSVQQHANYVSSKPPPGPQQAHYVQRDEQEEQRLRHDEARQHRAAPAPVLKDHHYSSDEYVKYKKSLQQQDSEDYRQYLQKEFQPKWKIGLPLGQYKYEPKRLLMEHERNKEYNDLVTKLPEIKSNRSGAGVSGMTPAATSLTLPVGSYDALRPVLERQRNEEYNNLQREGRLDKKGSIRQKAATPPDQQGLFDNQYKYQDRLKYMEKQRNKEYNEFLRQKYAKGKMSTRSEPDRLRASPYIGHDDELEMKKRYLAEERSRQYNQMLSEKEPPRSRSVNIATDVDSGLPIGQHHHEAWRRFQREQRNREYNQMINMQRVKDAPRRHDYLDHRSTGPYEGIFSGLGDHGNTKETLGQQRRQEYNDRLDQYPQAKASGRPTWVKETLPNSKEGSRSPMRNPHQVDHYQQMLDEKRREEAQRRRFDDHDYQGRNPRDDRHMSDMQQKYDYYPGE